MSDFSIPGVRDRDAARTQFEIDPEILEAVGDVDRSLLRWHLSLSTRERLRACTRATSKLVRLRREPSESS